ncbi:TldD/PmbA family protein [Acetobacteraceae bacterium ESL0709]|nr:TldD/PmbA family protein [Acetobacteraceae bacterium ESL0697]MDF7677787.1 TldD/PmbA family protein [Acetobacteraceae bacterium ESL0709]
MNKIEALLTQALDLARQQGAEDADVVVSQGESDTALVRNGTVEGVKHSEQLGLGLRVFIDGKVALVSTHDVSAEALSHCAERACDMAAALPPSPFDGLLEDIPHKIDSASIDQLDLVDRKTILKTPDLIAQAQEMEQTALGYKDVTNSNGASASRACRTVGYATSRGFLSSYQRTYFNRSISVVAGPKEAMERDYASHSALHYADLKNGETLGREAAERAVNRLHPQKPHTATLPVIFDRRISSSLIEHFLAAINGSALVQKTSFLTEKMGEKIFPENVTIEDKPLIPRGLGSHPFDMEGHDVYDLNLAWHGLLTNWLLDSRCARQLGLPCNGRAARSYASAPHPGISNIIMRPGQQTQEDMIREIPEGVLITEMMGNAINPLTGDYSRGASGFMIRQGNIAEPLSGFTIAGNLNDMFSRFDPASDLLMENTINAPSIRIDGMTIAGE